MLSQSIICNRYQIKKQLSIKAGKTTYLAWDFVQKKQVIIKILEFNQLFSWDDLKLFEREAKTLKNINHPNIPQYLDYFEIDRGDFHGFALVQTYIAAPSLKELIQQGIKFSEVEIIELAQKLLDLLNYLHQLNPPVIHRDLKPSNILLTNRSSNSIGDVYLVDFGSVQTVAKKEAGTITIVGTYGYIPLEQFMGQTTFASDLYSLGMTLIYLITGLHPADLTKTSGKVKFDCSNISRSFARWLTKITEPYTEQRYKSAANAKTALAIDVMSKRVISTNFLPVNNVPFETKSIIELRDFFPQLKSETTIYFPFKSKYHNLKVVRDRNRLDIIYLASKNSSKFYYQLYQLLSCLFSYLIIVIFPYNILGLILILLALFCIFYQVNFFYLFCHWFSKNKSFRAISITKNRYVSSSLFDCMATNKEEAYNYFLNHNRRFASSVSLPNQVKEIFFNTRYTLDTYSTKNSRIEQYDRVFVKSQVSLSTGDRQVLVTEFSSKEGIITQAELKLLAEEISSFLELELQVIPLT